VAGPTPIIRQLILCEHVAYDHAEGYRLLNPRVDFVVEPGETFPLAHPELWVFAQVTGSYGRQSFRVRMVDVTDPTGVPQGVFETTDRVIDLGRPAGPIPLGVEELGGQIGGRTVSAPRPVRIVDGLRRDPAGESAPVGQRWTMSEPFVPGPDDHFRGVIEFDCSEFLSPELKAKLRIGKFVPVTRPGGDVADDPAAPPPNLPKDEAPPGP
jgi:hypothetical protein